MLDSQKYLIAIVIVIVKSDIRMQIMGRYTVYAFQLVENAEMKIQALLPHERMFYVSN